MIAVHAVTWHRGACGVTKAGEGGHCGEPGSAGKGSWTARSAEACARLCEGCGECKVVSFSPTDHDCSWFQRCELSKLQKSPHSWHHTLIVRDDGGQLVAQPAPVFPPLPAWMPEDGTQGYTPYFYQMDVPVRVRRSISYGRGWQLLRSRGAGSEATGPCDPPQRADSCNCSSSTILWEGEDEPLPGCLASAECEQQSRTGGGLEASVALAAPNATILLVLDATKADLRFPLGGNLNAGYAVQVRYIVRLCLSLQAVKNSLPIHLLPSGTRLPAAPAVEERLTEELGVHVLPPEAAPPHRAPSWSSKWTRSTFAKLRALTLVQFERIVLMDLDSITLRNIDHLAAPAAAPAFVFGWKCGSRNNRTPLVDRSPASRSADPLA